MLRCIFPLIELEILGLKHYKKKKWVCAENPLIEVLSLYTGMRG